jgi:predicted SprT family Zn-dependent metalloprotease
MTHHEAARFAHSSARIHVDHGIAHLRNWRALARHHGRRDNFPNTIRAVAGLLTDQQATQHNTQHNKALTPPTPQT